MHWKNIVEFLELYSTKAVLENGEEPKNIKARGFVTASGRQIAVDTTSSADRSNIWIEDCGVPPISSKYEFYSADRTRKSSLSSVAPRLTGPGYSKKSYSAYVISINSISELKELFNWYSRFTLPNKESDENMDKVSCVVGINEVGNPSINKILYGPPGTGKTYSTFLRAVLTCDGRLPATGGSNDIKKRFDELRREGRITFVTFHQSYGYEEFVEGLRPVANASGQVSYSVIPGVFLRACSGANLRQLVKPGLTGKPLGERTIFKMSLGASWNDEGVRVFQYALKNECVLLGYGLDVDFSDCRDEETIRKKLNSEVPDVTKLNSHVWTVNYFKHELKIGDIIIVSNGNKSFRAIAEVVGDYEYVEDAPFHQMRAVKWLAVFEGGKAVTEILTKDFSMSTLYKIKLDTIKYDEIESLLFSGDDEQEVKPHLLIIDEINRANISKVFGELITLLEPDKREGAANALTVKLPYSGDDFTVPGNLHILGTMNTADRSIALLDTALRRRFDFEELLPDPNTLLGIEIEGINFAALLTSLNERIEILYDRDHTIGHAFFLNVSTLTELEYVFRRKVLPLLQEYFYENLSNVRRVLNDLGDGDFVSKIQRDALPSDGDDVYSDDPRTVFHVNKLPFPVEAYKRIYGGH